jgi:O-antigen/teichoic acid export membrane protein
VIRQVEEERERLIRIFRKMLRFAAFISMPCMFGLALTAPEIITIAITDKWLESARLMQILCIGAAFMPIQTLMYNMIISKERSDICLWNTIVFGITQIVVELFCYPYGITTMVWAFTAMNIAWLTVWWYYVWKLTGLSGWLVLKDVLPFVVIAGGSILAAGYAAAFTPNIYWSLLVKIAVAVVLYASVMYLSGANIFRESVAQITGMIRKKHE